MSSVASSSTSSPSPSPSSSYSSSAYVPRHPPEKIREVMEFVKVRHRSEYTLDEWDKYQYADRFPALRKHVVDWLETLDALHNGQVHEQASAVDALACLRPALAAPALDRAAFASRADHLASVRRHNAAAIAEAEIAASAAASPPHPGAVNRVPEAAGSALRHVRSVDRFHTSELSVRRFKTEYENKCLPVMISGCCEHWPSRGWDLAALDASPYADARFRCGDDDDGKAMRVPLTQYLQYAATNRDDSPLYLFEDSFDEDPVAKGMLADYEVPVYFRQDMFPLLAPDRRPPFRWVLVGPERSGTRMHLDPLSTSAWNVLLSGRKRWCLLRPNVPKDVALGRVVWNEQEKKDGRSPQAIYWFQEILPRLREYVARHEAATGEDWGLVEFIQYPGEVVFVPSGWWHVVMNLDDTVALTQNWVSTDNFVNVWRDLRTRRKHLARRLLQRLRVFYPDLVDVAREADRADGFRWRLRIRRDPPPGACSPAAAAAALEQARQIRPEWREVDPAADPMLQAAVHVLSVGNSDSSSDSDSDTDSDSDSESDSETEAEVGDTAGWRGAGKARWVDTQDLLAAEAELKAKRKVKGQTLAVDES